MGRDETQKILFPQVHTIIKVWGCNLKRFDFKAVSSTYFYKNSLLSYKPQKILNLDIFYCKKKEKNHTKNSLDLPWPDYYTLFLRK